MTVTTGRPSVGRTVHYVSLGSAGGEYPSVCRAAVITEVGDGGRVGLAAINPSGVFFHSLADGGCSYDESAAGGSWHWPERVD